MTFSWYHLKMSQKYSTRTLFSFYLLFIYRTCRENEKKYQSAWALVAVSRWTEFTLWIKKKLRWWRWWWWWKKKKLHGLFCSLRLHTATINMNSPLRCSRGRSHAVAGRIMMTTTATTYNNNNNTRLLTITNEKYK